MHEEDVGHLLQGGPHRVLQVREAWAQESVVETLVGNCVYIKLTFLAREYEEAEDFFFLLLTCEDFGKGGGGGRLIPRLLFFFFSKVEISSRAPISHFRSRSVHSHSAS